MGLHADDRPQIQSGIKGSGAKPIVMDLTDKAVIIGVSNGNQLQEGEHLKNTILLLKHFHNAKKITVCETSALKVFSIASNLLLDKSADERNQRYQQALIEKWEKASLATIWQDVQIARTKFMEIKGTKNLGELQAEAEQKGNYVFGLVIRAQQTYEKWLRDTPALTEEFKQSNSVETISWLQQVQNSKSITFISELIDLYLGEPPARDASIFKKFVDSSVLAVFARKLIKNIELDSLSGKLNILYNIEECGIVRAWGDTEPGQNPTYNYFMYINKLPEAMYYVLDKLVWRETVIDDQLLEIEQKNQRLKSENLQFRRIEFKMPGNVLYKEFWDTLESKGASFEQKIAQPDKSLACSLEEIYQYLAEVVKLSLDYFSGFLDSPYFYGFALKLIEYINLNFEQLERILDTILPPSRESQSIEKIERLVMNHIKLKVLVFKDFDYAKTPLVPERITLFGNSYLEKVKLIKKDSDALQIKSESLIAAPEEGEQYNFKCSIM